MQRCTGIENSFNSDLVFSFFPSQMHSVSRPSRLHKLKGRKLGWFWSVCALCIHTIYKHMHVISQRARMKINFRFSFRINIVSGCHFFSSSLRLLGVGFTMLKPKMKIHFIALHLNFTKLMVLFNIFPPNLHANRMDIKIVMY